MPTDYSDTLTLFRPDRFDMYSASSARSNRDAIGKHNPAADLVTTQISQVGEDPSTLPIKNPHFAKISNGGLVLFWGSMG